MSKMAEMHETIEELRNAAAAISDAADWLTKILYSTESRRQRMLPLLLLNRS